MKKIEQYINDWKEKGYPDDIPDEVPNELMTERLAPSYKAIAIAILKNDWNFSTLGFQPKKNSKWYGILKRRQLEAEGRLDDKYRKKYGYQEEGEGWDG